MSADCWLAAMLASYAVKPRLSACFPSTFLESQESIDEFLLKEETLENE